MLVNYLKDQLVFLSKDQAGEVNIQVSLRDGLKVPFNLGVMSTPLPEIWWPTSEEVDVL